MALVGVLIGSETDFAVIEDALKVLKEFGVEFELEVASAHRTPERVCSFSKTARERGLKVIIAAAGSAAHLAGVVASQTTLPVLGVPLSATSLGGLDSLLSIVQMPAGIPVGTFAIGKAGAKNAALMAISILSLSESSLAQRLDEFREKMAEEVLEKSERLKRKIEEEW